MPFGIGSAIGLGTSLLGGLLGGPDKVNETPYLNQSRKYGSLGDRFLDPNDPFYVRSINKQKQTLLDMWLAGARQKKQQLASQGINSNALNDINVDAGGIQATEGANKYGIDLRNQGVGYAQGFYGLSNQSLGQYQRAQEFNAGAGNSFKDQIIGGGLGLLGSAIGSEKGLSSFWDDLFGKSRGIQPVQSRGLNYAPTPVPKFNPYNPYSNN